MGTRGPKSAAAMSLAHVEPGRRRPGPPAELGAEAAVQWRTIVDSMPEDWFRPETHAMLKQLCRQIVRANLVAQALDGMRDSKRADFRDLLRLELQLSNSIVQLSTKMRISQQSSYDKSRKHSKSPKKHIPWEEAA